MTPASAAQPTRHSRRIHRTAILAAFALASSAALANDTAPVDEPQSLGLKAAADTSDADKRPLTLAAGLDMPQRYVDIPSTWVTAQNAKPGTTSASATRDWTAPNQ